MNKKTNKIVHLCYSVALSAMTVILGALFIWQILDIYLAGNNPVFTPERLGAGASRVAPAFWLWVAMIVGGFIIGEVFPVPKKREPYREVCYLLYRLKKRMPKQFEGEYAEVYAVYKKAELLKKILWSAVAALGAACAIYTIVYLATPSNFSRSDVTENVLEMIKHVMPFVAAVFVLALLASFGEAVITKRQLPGAKKLAAVKKTEKNTVAVYPNKFIAFWYTARTNIKAVTSHRYFLLGVRIAVGCVGVAFVIAGILNGNADGVLMKAIKICLECIGIG